MDNSQRFLIAGETGNRNYDLFCLNKAFFIRQIQKLQIKFYTLTFQTVNNK